MAADRVNRGAAGLPWDPVLAAERASRPVRGGVEAAGRAARWASTRQPLAVMAPSLPKASQSLCRSESPPSELAGGLYFDVSDFNVQYFFFTIYDRLIDIVILMP